jgi:hypothetical protein
MRLIKSLAIAFASALVIAPVASAADHQRTLCQRAHPIRSSIVKKHGERAAGRDICEKGVVREKKGGTRPPTKHEKAKYLRVLRRLNSPPPSPLLVRVAVPPKQPPAGTATASVAAPGGGTLDRIAQCESGGSPTAVNPNGHYGKYQFDLQTWQSVGGSGNPAAAPEAEQDRRAATLYAQRGGSPWACAG